MDENPSGVRISPSPQINMKIKNIVYILLLSFLFPISSIKVATVSHINGSCYVENLEQGRSSVPLTGSSIFNNDIISSKEESFCDVVFDDDATKIHIDENTKVKILSDKYSRIIKLFYGSIFVSNAKVWSKTYIQTLNNDIYVYNNNIWVDSYEHFDKVVAINYNADIYNHLSESKIMIRPLTAYNISSNGSVEIDNDLDLVPDYIENESYLQTRKINRKKTKVYLNDYDLIPVYEGKSRERDFNNNGFSLSMVAGTRYMNSDEYLSFGFSPQYKYNDLTIYAKFNIYYDYFLRCNTIESCEFTESGIYANWESKNDIIEKFHLRYSHSDFNNSLDIYAGEIPKVTFGHGYLVNKFSNHYEYPLRNDFGININFKLDNDFMNFQFIVPSFREYFRDGGIFGMHTSLFLSHRFPLTLGLGLLVDINQFSQAPRIYDVDSNAQQRKIYAAEFDFNLDILRRMDLDISLYGEFVGIWYPENIYYFRSDGLIPFGDDMRWRKGTWGIMAPGISIKIDNKHEINFAFNFNSAAFYPSYFNSNYLYNRSLYYSASQPFDFNTMGFNLLGSQIGMLSEFSIGGDDTQFFIPKELYPIITNKINVFPIHGFTAEYKFNFRNKVEYSSTIGLYIQKIDPEKLSEKIYYTFDSALSIKENVLKNLSNLDFYISNVFFLDADDKDEYIFGFNMTLDLSRGMSLIFDVAQVYYDSNLDGNKNSVLNSGLELGVNF